MTSSILHFATKLRHGWARFLGIAPRPILQNTSTIKPLQETIELEATLRAMARGLEAERLNLAETPRQSTQQLAYNDHRINNTLQIISSMVNLHVRELGQTGENSILSGLQYRVQALSVVHDRLFAHEEAGLIPLAPALKDIVLSLQRTLISKGSTIEFDIDIDPITAESHVAMPVSLLVAELMQKADRLSTGKHRHTSRWRIALGRDTGDRASIQLSSDHPTTPQTDSLNQQILNALCTQLGGQLEAHYLEGSTNLTVHLDLPHIKT